MLTPINLNDPEAFMSQLSSAEQSCISETGDPRQLLMLMRGPGPGSPQDAQELIPCLWDETLLRLFLTGLTGQTEPLSAETSTCVRSGFQDFDIATVLLSSSMGPGGEAAAMMGSMAGFVLTLSCLNEEEWQMASPRLGLRPGRPGEPAMRDEPVGRARRVGRSAATQGRGTSHGLHQRRNGMRTADGRPSGTRNS